jgi:hypothetical protein
MPKHKQKSEFPEKLCPVCGLAFKWRKKWERNWDSVVYCSDRCRMNKNTKLYLGEEDTPLIVNPS